MHFPYASDLQQLHQLYNRSVFSFVFLYGRDGVGKTRLIREFCADKRTLFLSGREVVPALQLSSAAKEAARMLKKEGSDFEIHSWKQLFTIIAEASFSRRLVVVLDEFQFFAEHDPAFFQAFSDCVGSVFQTGRIFLIITTSSTAYAASFLSDKNQPLVNQLSARSHMGNLSFAASQAYLSSYSFSDQLLLYGMTGGIYSLLEYLDTSADACTNIKRMFFTSDSQHLFSVLHYMHRELREVSTYNQLLEIIAAGNNRLADIAELAVIGTNKCAKYLINLTDLGILKKEIPCIGDNSKKVRYIFADHMLRFWYRYVYPNISIILSGQGALLFETEVLPDLPVYLEEVYEDVCREYLMQLFITKQAPFFHKASGSWWKGGTKREAFFRIPLIAYDEHHIILGCCNSSDQPMEASALEKLLPQFEDIGDKQRYYCVFSVSGFTPSLVTLADEQTNVWMISPEDMMN